MLISLAQCEEFGELIEHSIFGKCPISGERLINEKSVAANQCQRSLARSIENCTLPKNTSVFLEPDSYHGDFLPSSLKLLWTVLQC